MSSMEKQQTANFGSRFGYVMVAAGAAIGLGNIWKFPYLAYGGGGGAFIAIYLVFVILLGRPVAEMENAIGRYARTNAIDAYGVVNPKWKFVGAIQVLCTVMIDMYYIIVSGYVLKYAIMFLRGANFGGDNAAFYMNFISDPVEPLIYAILIMVFTIVMLQKGMTEWVEKVTKVIMPMLFLLLVVCGVWALFKIDGAVEGLKFLFIPNFSNLTWKVVADACMQVMFSVGIGWTIFVTVAANMQDSAKIRQDSTLVCLCDTLVAVTAGFVIIPSVVGSGMDMTAGPSLIFLAMTEIFGQLPGGNIMGFLFFTALIFAVISTYFTILEIPVKCVEEKLNWSRPKALWITGGIIMLGGVFCSLSQGEGLLSGVKLPWWAYNTGVVYYNIYDWVDCFTGYVLLPLGCLLTAFYCAKVWGFDNLEKELMKDGRDGKYTRWDKIVAIVFVPVLTLIVILNCFGFIV